MRFGIVLFGLVCFTTSAANAMVPKEIYRLAGPAVVLVIAGDGASEGAGGTGSIIDAQGRVVTNAHVVVGKDGKPFGKIFVYLKPPKISGDNARDLVNRYSASVLAFSPRNELDLAVLQIDQPPKHLPWIKFADPEKVEIGDYVVAIGHPEQAGLWTLTTGTVSTVIANFTGVRGKDVFQTEASINRGNSGGPLLDEAGEMIGINTSIARRAEDGVAITDVNFAIKSSVAVSWLLSVGYGASREATPLAKAAEPASGAVSSQESIVKGARLDTQQARKRQGVLTPKRPYSLADLRRREIRGLEKLMDEMRSDRRP